MILDEFDNEVFEDVSDNSGAEEDQVESEVEATEDAPKAKKQKKTFNPDALANAFQSVLRQNLPGAAVAASENNEGSGSEESEVDEKASVPILAKSKAIDDLEEAQIDYRARKILKAQIRSTQESVHFPLANAPETLNFERSLRKLATRGVVQLFNAIQAGQQQKDEEKRLKRQEKLAEAQRNLPLLGKESSTIPLATSSSSASYFDFLKQQQQAPKTL
jgi:hypothetical protein